MAEGIAHSGGTFAVELILQRADDRGAGTDHLLEGLIDVTDVQMN
jgi:hypothetical protein